MSARTLAGLAFARALQRGETIERAEEIARMIYAEHDNGSQS